jgi:iron(III) transport system substrate-binding protein
MSISREAEDSMRWMFGRGMLGLLACVAIALVRPDVAWGQGSLTLYCSPQIEWCQLVVAEFTRVTGIKVAMTRKSSGETFARIKAEASNPKGDV